jgi:hypothetical protein
MATDTDGYLEQRRPRGVAVERVKSLSLGGKIVLACSSLLFLSLFLTWQRLEIDYGSAGTGTLMLDGWDLLGLLIGLLTLALVVLMVVVKLSDLEMSADVPWELVALVTASAMLGLAVLKNLTDRNSAWPSYLALVLAAAVVAGAYLDWLGARPGKVAPGRPRRRRFRSSA